LKKKAAVLYLLGVMVFLWGSFAGLDLSNPDDLARGFIGFIGWMFIMLVLYWMDKQSLFPWRDLDRAVTL
jgi:hypothetical protein